MNIDLQFYWGLFLRRLPVMTALFLVVLVSAGVAASNFPRPIQPLPSCWWKRRKSPTGWSPRVREDADQQLQVIEQRLLTRANMLDIARKFSVFENMRAMTPDRSLKPCAARPASCAPADAGRRP